MRRLSLVTCVPPVTELRVSVPGSLSTGADSPVIAALRQLAPSRARVALASLRRLTGGRRTRRDHAGVERTGDVERCFYPAAGIAR